MAKIYQKEPSDKCIILDPREALERKMSLPASWSRLRVGMLYSWTNSTDDNSAIPNDGITHASVLDRFVFGIKNSGGAVLGQTGNHSLCLTTIGPDTGGAATFPAYSDGAYRLYSNSYGFSLVVGNGTSLTAAASGFNELYQTPNCNQNTATGYWTFTGFDIQISGTNAVGSIQHANVSPGNIPTSTLLKSLMISSGFQHTSSSVAGWWTSGQTPDTDHFYIRAPFLYSRLRIHSYGYIVIA